MITKQDTESFLFTELKQLGFKLETNALSPFEKIGFEKLHQIYDHEEWFLKVNIVEGIVDSFKKRTGSLIGTIKSDDVLNGIIRLGNKVRLADNSAFDHKSQIKDACPYC